MKKVILLILVFSVSILLTSCGKKETAGTDSKDKTEKKTEDKKDIAFSDNSAYHIKYEASGEKEKGTLDIFFKGKSVKMDVSQEMDKDPSRDLVNLKDKLKDYEKVGTDEILGYKCDVYQTKEGSKISVYKDYIGLKMVEKSGKTFIATAFEPDIKLANDFFSPPKDI